MRVTEMQALAAGVVAMMPMAASAAPVVLTPSATIAIPDERYEHITDVAIDGDWLIMTAGALREPNPFEREYLQGAFLFRRTSSGEWTYIRTLEDHAGILDDREIAIRVAMNAGIAAIAVPGGIRAYEHRSDEWVAVPMYGSSGGYTLEIHDGTILASDIGCGAGTTAYRKNSAGAYVAVHHYQALPYFCSDGEQLESGDIWGSTVVMHQQDNETAESGYYVWEGLPPSAPPATIPQGTTVGEGVIAGLAYKTPRVCATDVYRRQAFGSWTLLDTLILPDAMSGDQWLWCPTYLQFEQGLLLQSRQGDTQVFQRGASGHYKHVAKLRDVSGVHVSGNRAAGTGSGHVHVYELPATLSAPDLKQDTFQDGNAHGWQPTAESRFSIASTPQSYVYRQSSLTGGARSIWESTDWTNQSIQADVKPTAFASDGERWFGLVTRYTDDGNYYYVTARTSNVIQIRKIVDGAYQVLASTTLPVTLNRAYQLRLEAIGRRLSFYVDGKLMLEAQDSSHSHGRSGVMMYKTRADIDNVVLTSHDLSTLLNDTFRYSFVPDPWWEAQSGTWATLSNDSVYYYEQTSTSGIARAITGVATDVQSVQVRMTPTAFAGTSNAWSGVMARYVDTRNYYYVTVRNDHTVSLRKLVDDVPYVLDTGSLNVVPGRQYAIRLEAVGSSLRVYVDGVLQLEANDTTFASGRYGLALYKAAARFNDFLATQP